MHACNIECAGIVYGQCLLCTCIGLQVEQFDDGSGQLDLQEFKLCATGLNLPVGRAARARVPPPLPVYI